MQQFFTPFLDLVVKNQGWKVVKPQTVRAAGLCPVQSVLSHRRSECVGKVIITSQAKISFALHTSHTRASTKVHTGLGRQNSRTFKSPSFPRTTHWHKNLKLTRKPCLYKNKTLYICSLLDRGKTTKESKGKSGSPTFQRFVPETVEQERGAITISNTTIQIFKDLQILLLILKDFEVLCQAITDFQGLPSTLEVCTKPA